MALNVKTFNALRYRQYLSSLIVHVEGAGLSVEQLFSNSTITAKSLEQETFVVDDHAVRSVEQNFVQMVNCQQVGFRMGKSLQFTTLGVLGIYLMACKNIASVVRECVTYQSILRPAKKMYVRENDQYIFMHKAKEDCQHLSMVDWLRLDFDSSSMVTLFQFLTNGWFRVERIVLPTTDLYHLKRYENWFECPVVSGDEYGIQISQFTGYKQLPNYNEYCQKACHDFCQQVVEQISDKTFEERVYSKVESFSEEWPSEQEFASFFNLSTRTLRRRLSEFNVTFHQLISERKQEIAHEYLTNSSESLERIAGFCGFSDASSFSTAFKKWTKFSPAKYRKEHSR